MRPSMETEKTKTKTDRLYRMDGLEAAGRRGAPAAGVCASREGETGREGDEDGDEDAAWAMRRRSRA
jgi:hypothetical protein